MNESKYCYNRIVLIAQTSLTENLTNNQSR